MKTEEQLVRELLHQAVELPDELSPPIGRLIRRGHSSRARRTVLASVAAVAVVVAGVAAPSLAAGFRSASSGSSGPTAGTAGPTAAQLARYRWSKLAPSPLGRSGESIVAWAGNELLEIGYLRNAGASTASAAFDPVAGRWHLIAPEPTLIDPRTALTAWTGHQLFVVGVPANCAGIGLPGACAPEVQAYDVAANQWSTAKLPSSFEHLEPLAAAWTGHQLVVAGSILRHGEIGVAAYSPASRRWRVITPRLAVRHPLWNPVGIFPTGHGLILWTSWMHVSDKAGSHRLRFGAEVFIRDKAGTWSNHSAGWPKSAFVAAPTRPAARSSRRRCGTTTTRMVFSSTLTPWLSARSRRVRSRPSFRPSAGRDGRLSRSTRSPPRASRLRA